MCKKLSNTRNKSISRPLAQKTLDINISSKSTLNLIVSSVACQAISYFKNRSYEQEEYFRVTCRLQVYSRAFQIKTKKIHNLAFVMLNSTFTSITYMIKKNYRFVKKWVFLIMIIF